MHTTWHTRLDWVSTSKNPPETLETLLEDLTAHAPSGSITPDEHAGSVMVTVDAESFDGALSTALDIVRTALQQHMPDAQVIGIELVDSDALDRELERPLFPAVVGYAEIADMAGVSRARARAFRTIDGFPAPVIETAQGPLMAKAAVQQWLHTRNTRPGRRPAVPA